MKTLLINSLIFSASLIVCVNANATDFWSDDNATKAEEQQEQARFKKEIQKIELERKDMFNNVLVPQKTSLPNVDTNTLQGIDIDQLAARYKTEVQAEQQQNNRVMVFISFSMPDESIKKAIQDAKKIDGVLVLRGFYNGSYQETAQRIYKLGEKVGNIQIHPDAFKKYQVKTVPTVVMVEEQQLKVGEDGCALPDSYIAVAGDVPLSYALEQFIKSGDDRQKSLARRYLGHLEH